MPRNSNPPVSRRRAGARLACHVPALPQRRRMPHVGRMPASRRFMPLVPSGRRPPRIGRNPPGASGRMTLGQSKPRRDDSTWRQRDARATKIQVVGRRGESRHAGPDVSGVRPLPGLSPPLGWPPRPSHSPWSWRHRPGPPERRPPRARRSRSRPPRCRCRDRPDHRVRADAVPLHRGPAGRCRRARARAPRSGHRSSPPRARTSRDRKGVKGLSLINVGNGHWQVAFHNVALYRFEGDKKKGQAQGRTWARCGSPC